MGTASEELAGKTRVCVGAVSGAHGVRGEVRIKTFTTTPGDIGALGPVETEDGKQIFTVTVTRPVKGGVAAKLSGIADRDAALALRGNRLYAQRAGLPDLPQEPGAEEDEEYYHADLVGLTVRWSDGQRSEGKIVAVHDFGAGDLLEVALEPQTAGKKHQTVLLPFTRDTVPEVNMDEGFVCADPPFGLMPGEGEANNAQEKQP